MPKATEADERADSVSHLLSPQAALIADIFRALGDFESHYDVEALESLERRLSRLIPVVAAKSVVSDALLLAFALRSEGRTCWALQPIGSRRATSDEYCLLGLLAAVAADDRALATQAANALGIVLNGTIVSLGRDIGARLMREGMPLHRPDRRLLPVMAAALLPAHDPAPARSRRSSE